MCLCVLLLSTILIMRDGEENVLTTGNMFCNTLSAWQVLRWHRRWSRRRSSMPTLVPLTSDHDYFDDVDIPTSLVERICYLYLLLICTASTCTVAVKQAILRQCQTPYVVCIYQPLSYATCEVDQIDIYRRKNMSMRLAHSKLEGSTWWSKARDPLGFNAGLADPTHSQRRASQFDLQLTRRESLSVI